MSIRLEWDPRKALRNHRKHGVTFREAASTFNDPKPCILPDHRHSDDEERWIFLGRSALGRLIAVMFTERDENRVRLISARRATARERSVYEENVE